MQRTESSLLALDEYEEVVQCPLVCINVAEDVSLYLRVSQPLDDGVGDDESWYLVAGELVAPARNV